MRLVLVRHGATPNNLDARYTGQSDIAMSELGERQAAALAARLASRLAARRFDTLVSSDLARARGTAERLAAALSLPLQFDPDLREVGMGEWEGRSVAEVAARYRHALAAWERDPIRFAPPGGESLEQFVARIRRSLARWTNGSAGDTVLMVTHGGVIGVAVCLALGLPLDFRRRIGRDNTSITELELDRAVEGEGGMPLAPRNAHLVRLNDTAHLEGLMQPGEGEAHQVL